MAFLSERQPPSTLLGTASANGSTKPFSEPLNCCCTDVVFPKIDGRRCWPRRSMLLDRWSAWLLMKRPTKDCFVFLGDPWMVWHYLHGCWLPGLCFCVDMCEIRTTPFVIQWSLWKGIPLNRLCVYQMAEKAQSLSPIWLRALPFTTTARTHQTLTPLSRNLTVWVATTWEMNQRTKLTVYEVKDKMTKALFQRTLSVALNRLCRAGLHVVANPLIGMVSMSRQFDREILWRLVCCCLAALICLFAERWLLPRQLGAVGVRISRRVLSEPSCCRYYVFLTLLFVSADGNCDFMLIKA